MQCIPFLFLQVVWVHANKLYKIPNSGLLERLLAGFAVFLRPGDQEMRVFQADVCIEP